jgi:hypothetical protein
MAGSHHPRPAPASLQFCDDHSDAATGKFRALAETFPDRDQKLKLVRLSNLRLESKRLHFAP